jgi:hypothetical protein
VGVERSFELDEPHHPMADPLLEAPLDEPRGCDRAQVDQRAGGRRDGQGPHDAHPRRTQVGQAVHDDAVQGSSRQPRQRHLDEARAEAVRAPVAHGASMGEGGVMSEGQHGAETALLVECRNTPSWIRTQAPLVTRREIC